MTAQQVLENGLKLSPKEREEVAHGLFDSIICGDEEEADEDDELELAPEVIEELERVVKEADANPDKFVTWEEVMARRDIEVNGCRV